MAKMSLTSLVTLFTHLNLALASTNASPAQNLHKRHHQLAERAHHDPKHIARSPLEGASTSIQLKPRTVKGLGRRDGSAAEYTLLGCFSELSTAGMNVLNHPVPWNQTTIQTCVESCYTAASSPYTFAGVIAGSECRCDNAISALATQVPQSNCRAKCANGVEGWCGGPTSYQIYHLPSVPNPTATETQASGSISDVPVPTSINPAIPSTLTVLTNDISYTYNYLGCYEDNTGITTRALRGPGFTSSTMTPTACAQYCVNLGYPFAGTEYGGECFCGATLFSTSSKPDECIQACTGDSTLVCGAPLRISIHAVSDPSLLGALEPLPSSSSGEWTSVGCYIDDTSAPPMDFAVSTVPEGLLSVDTCAQECKLAGYTFTGLEYGSQCFCSNAVPPLQADAHDCDMPCPVGGGSCGAGWRLDVYKRGI